MRKTIFILIITTFTNILSFSQTPSDSRLSKIDYAKPKEYEIGGVSISGIKYLDQNVLVHLSGLKVGEKITIPGEDITNAINKLWKHGLFGDVEISATKIVDDKIYLNIYLKERPRLSKYVFTGVKKAQADDLKDEVKLIRGSQVTDDIINTTKNTVRNYFVEKGYYNTVVNISQTEDSLMPNSVLLTIDIDKKNKIKIWDINIEGNEVFTDEKLQRTMKDTKKKTWYNIFKASKYIETKFEADKAKIIAKYNEKGYRDAAIEIDSVYVNDSRTLNIYMKIKEGGQYFFREVNWVGNTKYPSEVLDQSLGITKGDVFDQSILDKRLFGDEDAVSSLYLDRGYLFFSAVPVETRVENDSIDLEVRIFEGKQARINKIIITGNTRTNEHVIRREIHGNPGELFSRADIIRTNRELANLGYFDPEKLDVKPVPHPEDGTVDIEYVVEERASDQIELSGGWGGGMFIGTLGLTFNNFSLRNIARFDTYSPLPTGDGQKLSLRAQTNGKFYQSYSMSFTEPWLGGKKPNSLTFSLYHSINSRNYYGQGGLTSGDNMKVSGVSLGLGRRLNWPDTYFTLYNELSFRRYEMNNYDVGLGFANGTSKNVNFTTVLGRNSVDSPLYPRHGSNLSLSLTVTPPFSNFKEDNFWLLTDEEKAAITEDYPDTYASVIYQEQKARHYEWIEYYKWKFATDWYTQLLEKLVLRVNLEFGLLGSYNDNYGDSPFESYRVGGSAMQSTSYIYGQDIIPVRGYDNATLTAAPQANIYNRYIMELRYPLTLNPSATIYALVFAEAANSYNKADDIDPFNNYRAAGVGLRFWLPMFGLLGVDWGYGFDPVYGKGDASGSTFAFTIGQQF